MLDQWKRGGRNLKVGGKGDVTIENCTLDACSAIHLQTNDKSTAVIRTNTILDTSVVAITKNVEHSGDAFSASGNSKERKVFQGNFVARGKVLFRAPNWLIGGDTDAENQPLTATLVAGPTRGMVALNANGSFAYIPNAHFSGSDSFTYRAFDGTSFSNVATVTLTIAPNIAPTLAAIANPAAISEDAGPQSVTVTGITAGGGASQRRPRAFKRLSSRMPAAVHRASRCQNAPVPSGAPRPVGAS